jgi:asparagine synthase (glutamine-hydrolysing)
MCGIAGFFQSNPHNSPRELQELVLRMSDKLRHRGPDDGGGWVDADTGIALGMRRLAILDLSEAGHQPMHSASGRYVIVYNGEIYNCEDLRRSLENDDPNLRFRGHSDTEVMLAAFEQWGVLGSLRLFNGMFAFALWDRQQRTLTLARDRFGEKPLYYSMAGGTLLFGSELKALRVHPEFSAEIDRGSLALYLRHNCVPAPYSIYGSVRKLPPASVMTLSATNFDATPQPYWSVGDIAEAGVADPFSGTEDEAVEQLDCLLHDAVRIRMYSDVPLGAFLSGGIDSSTVVSLMQSESTIPVKTFSIGSEESAYNEASEASLVAAHLHTDHTELYVTPEQAMEVVPLLPMIYDEPFADSSQIPTFLVSQLARRQVTVSLSGDGGDEIFGGYNRHTWVGPLWRKLKPIPTSLRKLGAASITTLSPQAWNSLFRTLDLALPKRFRQRLPGDKLHKLAAAMGSPDAHRMYYRLASHWSAPEEVVPNSREPSTLLNNGGHAHLPTAIEEMMYLDAVTYLPDDILVKVDRATMSVSLEGRIPMLDHRVAEFAWRLPLSMRVRQQQGKWILRQVLYRYVPRELVERPKTGFGIPLGSWLRGPLRDWAETLLREERLRREGFFNPQAVRQLWREHLSERRNWEYHLWDVLMFQAWLEENRRAPKADVESLSGLTSSTIAKA